MPSPPPLVLPADEDGWMRFAHERPGDLLAESVEADERLKAGSGLTTREKLELWNDAESALIQASMIAELMTEVHPLATVRDAAATRLQEIGTRTSQRLVDAGMWRVFGDAEAAGADEGERRLLQRIRRDLHRAGASADPDTRRRLRELTERDAALVVDFARNIREDKREVRVEPRRLDGLPQDFLDAHPAAQDGLVALTTDYPDLIPVRTFAKDRALRAELSAAFLDVGWPANDAVLAELIELRAERATLLGYPDWADYEAETRMIGAGAAIPEFLGRLRAASLDATSERCAQLLERLRVDEPDADVVGFEDYLYALDALARERFGVDAKTVRSYFSFPQVAQGVLDVTGRLFDVEYVPVDAAAWHPDVTSYDVVRGGERLGRVHLDLFPRPGKFTHEACFGLAPGVHGRTLPEGVLVCNFSRQLMEHRAVAVFFHEFGHVLHHILGGHGRWTRFNGVTTEWDFVETPSQLLEEWVWDAEILASFATDAGGVPIPADLVERMRAADAFPRPIDLSRQLAYANVAYHLYVDRPADLAAATEHWLSVSTPVRVAPGTHLYAGFGHLSPRDPRTGRQPRCERPRGGVPGASALVRRLPGVARGRSAPRHVRRLSSATNMSTSSSVVSNEHIHRTSLRAASQS